MAGLITPYSTALPFVKTPVSWTDDDYDNQRLTAYNLYEDLYRNHPDTYQALLRGSDEKPIYVPTAKKLVNTLARYVARGWGINVVPADDPANGLTLAASDQEILDGMAAYGRLFKRERFLTQFHAAKKAGLCKGDWAFYIWADPNKPEGSRISIRSIRPDSLFPIFDDADPGRINGIDLVEQVTFDNEVFIKVQRFLKPSHPEHPGYGDGVAIAWDQPITREVYYLELSKWRTEPKNYTGKIGLNTPVLPQELVVGINHLPVYHIKNLEDPENPFGSSILAGLESLLSGINQAVSDEDLAMAMAGLGFYATDSGSPVNEQGEDVDWIIGPNRVAEIGEGKKFERVSGVATVEPSQKHIEALRTYANETLGISDVALGTVDSTIAESGIALALRFAPLLDAASENDLVIIDVMDQMLYDLREWFAVYEGINLVNVVAVSVLGEKLPVDRVARMKELTDLLLNNAITLEFYHERLQDEFGYNFPPGMFQELMDGGQRLDDEAGDPDAADATDDGSDEDSTDSGA